MKSRDVIKFCRMTSRISLTRLYALVKLSKRAYLEIGRLKHQNLGSEMPGSGQKFQPKTGKNVLQKLHQEGTERK